MASFHDQWMDAHAEVAELQWQGGFHVSVLEERLEAARLLIDEDNEPDERRYGGEIIRDVRQECRRRQVAA